MGNILRIKFNTTNYNSRLEYQIALIEKDNNINPLSIHKKFYENNLIYKNIIYSSGKEPIEKNISLIDDINNFTYDKDYTFIAYGKDCYSDSINYFYMEPLSLFISDPNNPNIENKITDIFQSQTTEELTDKIMIEPSIIPATSIEETINSGNKKSSDSKISTVAIVFIVIGGVVLLGGIAGLIIYFSKKSVINNDKTLDTTMAKFQN